MSTEGQRSTWSYADVLEAERRSGQKHEIQGGQLVAMTGGSLVHSRLSAEISHLLTAALRAVGCSHEIHSSDARYRLEEDTPRYPDASVICGPRIVHTDDEHAATNPAIVVEVLSPSTWRADCGEKLEAYLSTPSLRAYLLVSQARPLVVAHLRRGDVFERIECLRGDDIELAIDANRSIKLGVEDLYRSIILP